MAQIASITLYNNDEARPVIDAILADNEGARTLNMPGAVKIDCDGALEVRRASVEERIGQEWDLQEIHLIIISFAGNLDEDDDRIKISWNS